MIRWRSESLSVICIKHFEYIIKGRRRTLNWKFNPVDTIHSTEAMKRPSVLCFLISPGREPKKEESFEKDQLQQFKTMITSMTLKIALVVLNVKSMMV